MWSPVQGAAANRLGEAVTFENQLSVFNGRYSWWWLSVNHDNDYINSYDDLILIDLVNLVETDPAFFPSMAEGYQRRGHLDTNVLMFSSIITIIDYHQNKCIKYTNMLQALHCGKPPTHGGDISNRRGWHQRVPTAMPITCSWGWEWWESMWKR